VNGCLECATDHHLACALLGEEDDGFDADEDRWYSLHCCCGLAVDSLPTQDAEDAKHAGELRRCGWSRPADAGQQEAGRG
jgi:hypothetical protein